MTQEELRKEIHIVLVSSDLEDEEENLLTLINKHVAEVIGEDEICPTLDGEDAECPIHKEIRLKLAEQRKRAGLDI